MSYDDDWVKKPCRICGWGEAVSGLRDGLCIDCEEIRAWSRVNRAFCDLLHRIEEHADEPANLVPS